MYKILLLGLLFTAPLSQLSAAEDPCVQNCPFTSEGWLLDSDSNYDPSNPNWDDFTKKIMFIFRYGGLPDGKEVNVTRENFLPAPERLKNHPEFGDIAGPACAPWQINDREKSIDFEEEIEELLIDAKKAVANTYTGSHANINRKEVENVDDRTRQSFAQFSRRVLNIYKDYCTPENLTKTVEDKVSKCTVEFTSRFEFEEQRDIKETTLEELEDSLEQLDEDLRASNNDRDIDRLIRLKERKKDQIDRQKERLASICLVQEEKKEIKEVVNVVKTVEAKPFSFNGHNYTKDEYIDVLRALLADLIKQLLEKQKISLQ